MKVKGFDGRGAAVMAPLVRLVRVGVVREVGAPAPAPHGPAPVLEPGRAASILRAVLPADREGFAVLHLDARSVVRSVEVVSVGSLNASIVHPREVFKGALLANACAIILGHNHPSGDPEPSAEDIAITKRLVQIGELIGIVVLDHVIIGEGRHVSLHERGTL